MSLSITKQFNKCANPKNGILTSNLCLIDWIFITNNLFKHGNKYIDLMYCVETYYNCFILLHDTFKAIEYKYILVSIRHKKQLRVSDRECVIK